MPKTKSEKLTETKRTKNLLIKITGQVQGVGFRPFIYRLAKQFDLHGWVKNCSGEVIAQVQGHHHKLNSFQQAILNQHPPLAIPIIESITEIKTQSQDGFIIEKSATSEHAQRHIPPDFFTCNDCLAELTKPQERRYRYPFINCTQCGPRYTIIHDLPYDRPNTSMAQFPLCSACHTEYSDTLDRRFHAQPLACSLCGPELTFHSPSGAVLNGNESALSAAVDALKQGKILAAKGVGGYHLMCDATNESAVQRLRQRKHRPDKPLAVMFSTSGGDKLQQLKQYCDPDSKESELLISPQRPIVLIKAKKGLLATALYPCLSNIPQSLLRMASVNKNEQVGAMLAYSPLHYLILNDFGLPVVATSGNLSGEPVLTDNTQALTRLKKIADVFLQHNRPILRPADDSVVKVIHNKKRFFRIGRGYAPLELHNKQINLPFSIEKPVLAVGGQMKNTIALGWDKRIVISPHIGELDSKRSIHVFNKVIDDLCHLYRVKPKLIVCDAHPDYYSSRYAKDYSKKHDILLRTVQHHRAHASIVSGEFTHWQSSDGNSTDITEEQPWLVFSWDGTGLGDDKSIWGGEAFYGNSGNWQRVCSIKPFYLQGGDKAAREPWRSACALLWEKNLSCSTMQTIEYLSIAHNAWKKRLNTVPSSSMGRLFDAASAVLGLGNTSSFEGQGPMLLEACLSDISLPKSKAALELSHKEVLPLSLYQENELILADWSDLLPLLLDEQQSVEKRAASFHIKMAETLIAQANKIKARKGNFRVGLSGGVFQNKSLTEYLLERLSEENYSAYLPEKVPYNDAGLAFGQIIEGINQ